MNKNAHTAKRQPGRTQEPIPLIIDTDPGVDDATAIMLALSHPRRLDLRLLTSVGGNVGLERTTHNARVLAHFLHRDVDGWDAEGRRARVAVARGEQAPVGAKDASGIHGMTGLGNWRYDVSDEKLNEVAPLDSRGALGAQVALLEEARQEGSRVTIVAIGPLTNIRKLLDRLRDRPELVEAIEQIVIMGGSLNKGNKGPFTEFNFGTDPEAARAVLSQQILPEALRPQGDLLTKDDFPVESERAPKIVILPGDVAETALLTPAQVGELGNMNAVGAAIADLMAGTDPAAAGAQTKLLYDPTTIAYLCQPALFTTITRRVTVETQGLCTRGALVAFDGEQLRQMGLDGAILENPDGTVARNPDGTEMRRPDLRPVLREATICTRVDKEGLFNWLKASVRYWEGQKVGWEGEPED